MNRFPQVEEKLIPQVEEKPNRPDPTGPGEAEPPPNPFPKVEEKLARHLIPQVERSWPAP